ncbi:MAG: hypothetical protein WD490_01820 [Opitutales bacterium]
MNRNAIVNSQVSRLTLLAVFSLWLSFHYTAAAEERPGTSTAAERSGDSPSYATVQSESGETSDDGGIRPYRKNPWYWEYRGEPVMLIGASGRDNLWQWTGERLIEQLDLIESAGGNFVRNTMSDRNDGDTFAPKEIEDGVYDLEQWNEEYWEKLSFFLEETHRRGIIAQVTLWDWFDLSGGNVYGRFAIHPLNPANNINWEPGTIENAWNYYGGSLSDTMKRSSHTSIAISTS